MRKLYRMIMCLFSIFILLIINTNAISEDQNNLISDLNYEDIDPLVDIEVTVEIKQIVSLEKHWFESNSDERIDRYSDPDFYIKVFINDEEHVSPIWKNKKFINDPDWFAKTNVPDDEEYVKIKIELWDWNIGFDRQCDISSYNYNSKEYFINKKSVDLMYSIKTGHWNGDDWAYYYPIESDPSGYGRLNGCDDGSYNEIDRDCEVWFEIFQNDFDKDNIPYWLEVNEFKTDPEVNDKGKDFDDDGIPIEWEHKWGFYLGWDWHSHEYSYNWIYHPMIWDDHSSKDPDEDGLDNIEEYLTSQWGSDPFRKDIFLEIDQMEIGPNGQGSYISKLTKDLLKVAYRTHNIVLHIDDGCFGGGQTDLPFDDDTSRDELHQLYYKYFLNEDENYWRKGVFHYALIVYHASYPGYVFRQDSFQISTRAHDQIATRYRLMNRLYWQNMNLKEIRSIVYAGAMMHENGHTLGIYNGNTPGCDDQEGKMPWQINYWKWGSYKSCMNYRYVYRLVDYSDGTRGKNDFNDWGRIDLTLFQRDSW